MNTIFDLFLQNDSATQLSERTGISKEQASQAFDTLLPLLLNQLDQNTQTKEHAQALEQALAKHNGEDLTSLLSNLSHVDAADGSKINTHLFGNQMESIATSVGNQLGLDAKTTKTLMDVVSPLMMKYVAKEATSKEAKGDQLIDLTSLLGSEAKKTASNGGILETLLGLFTGK